MDYFDCIEDGHETITMVEVTEEETYEGVTTFMGKCPEHGDVSVSVNWGND